ncbi:MAG: ABC transporter substrate-binding protein [Lachnospiraceae bacterium]|nr:ABC transporter substrate-binding protein [Lachnospiraceae bacterium]
MRSKAMLISAILAFSMLISGCKAPTASQLNEEGREEIQLCISVLDVTMREVIADYNRKSDQYEIVPLEYSGDISIEDWRRRIQLELTNEKGPDILSITALQGINMKPYAESGQFLDVTDFLAKQGNIIRAATEANTIDGRQYGIPFSFSLNTMVTSSSMATDRENWTKDYCMQKTEESNTAVFIGAPYGWTREEAGLYTLNVLGVGMAGIQLFVNEEQGISSFEQQEFIDMLEFAKQYSDPVSGESIKRKQTSGEKFCTTIGLGNFSDFWYCNALFGGKPVYMGYPSPLGGVHQIIVNSFYINAASSHKDGALDFMRYLLTEEVLRKLVTEHGEFPVNQTLLESLWQEAQKECISTETGYEKNGIFYSPRLMTDEEERIFWEMLKDPIYYQWENDIWDIIWEEALPFFYGEKAAAEVAKIVDSKVQLYLDERK